jgi:RNA polymerase sigma-70 factor (ECF subfamily)
MATDGGGALAGRLGRIAGGDATAFTELVEAYDADMARLCLVICGDVELARDATQNAWHRLWTQPPTLRDDGKLRSWLLSVAANEARQMLRRRRRGAALEERAAVDGSATRSAGPEERSEEWMDLATALAALRPNERELVALRYVLELSSAQIAEHLGISAEGVRSRLHRLLARLRKELDR